jgi:hypothetical protein
VEEDVTWGPSYRTTSPSSLRARCGWASVSTSDPGHGPAARPSQRRPRATYSCERTRVYP